MRLHERQPQAAGQLETRSRKCLANTAGSSPTGGDAPSSASSPHSQERSGVAMPGVDGYEVSCGVCGADEVRPFEMDWASDSRQEACAPCPHAAHRTYSDRTAR